MSLRCNRSACSASANRLISSRHASIIATRAHCIWMPACASVRLMVAARDMARRFSSLICRATRASSASNAQTLAALTGSQADGHAPSTMLSSMLINVSACRAARALEKRVQGGGERMAGEGHARERRQRSEVGHWKLNNGSKTSRRTAVAAEALGVPLSKCGPKADFRKSLEPNFSCHVCPFTVCVPLQSACGSQTLTF